MTEDKNPKLFEDSNEKNRWTNLRPAPADISNKESKEKDSQRSRVMVMAGIACCCVLASCFFGKMFLLSCANLAVENNQTTLASSIYDTLSMLYPADFEVVHGRAVLKTIMGNYEAALVDDDQAVALRPNDAHIYSFRGFVRYKLHDDVGAIEDFTKVIALEPGLTDTYVRRGVVYARLGKYTSAVKDFDKALKMDPSNAEAMSYRSWALDQLNNVSMEIASNATPEKRRKKLQSPVNKPPDMNSTVEQMPNFGTGTNSKMLPVASRAQPILLPIAAQPSAGATMLGGRAPQTGVATPPIVASNQPPNMPQPSRPVAVRPSSAPAVASLSPASATTVWPSPSAVQKQNVAPPHFEQKPPMTPEDIATWAKPNYVKAFPRGWEMRDNSHFSFGQYELSIKNHEMMVTTGSEVCWLSDSSKFVPSDAGAAKVSFADDGNLTVSAMHNHTWTRYWWTQKEEDKLRPAVKLAFYESWPYLCILDQHDVPLWHDPEQAHVSLSSVQLASRAAPPPQIGQEENSANQHVTRSTQVDHKGSATLLIPVGAPSLALDADQAGTPDSLLVYPSTANNSLTQKWIVNRKQPGVFSIHPAFDRTLALTVTNGRFTDGTKVILSRDRGYSTQTWSFVMIGGKYMVLRPLCAPNLVLDNAGGPNSQVDLLRYIPGNVNTLWIVRTVSM